MTFLPSCCSHAVLTSSAGVATTRMHTSILFLLLLLLGSATAQSPGSQDLGTVLAARSNLSTFYNLVKKFPDILFKLPSYNGVTILAPSNEAFQNVPYTALNGVWSDKDPKSAIPILTYHILQGTIAVGALQSGPSLLKASLLTDPAYANVTSGQNIIITKQPGDVVVVTSSQGTRTTLLETDIAFSGGLIHITENLIIPPSRLEKVADSFKIPSFMGALYAAELMPAAAEQPNVTIFAPRNEAMKLVAGSLSALDKTALKKVVGYHIVPGQILASSLLQNDTNLTTQSTQPVHVRKAGNNLYINSAQVLQPDILLANGILHIIEHVLNPEAASVIPNPEVATQAPVFPVSTASGLPFTTALPCTANCPVTSTRASSSRTTSTVTSMSSTGGAAGPARCTGIVGGAGIGILGMGLGVGLAVAAV